MMFKIINKQILAIDVKRVDVQAPTIARKFHPGQFVSIAVEEGDDRFPLAIAEADARKGTITLIFGGDRESTHRLGQLTINESIFSILGPLGNASAVQKKGTVVCIATGIGTAQLLPICRALKSAGNKVIGIIGAKTKKALMLEAQFRLACHKTLITTNDGSYERRGLATELLETFLTTNEVHQVFAIGSGDMLKRVCQLTKEKGIPTRVHLNPVMVDCMGMCGSCRIKINKQIKLVCIDGPEFDGHSVDFEDYKIRCQAYEGLEQCRNRKFSLNPKKSESGTLTKFLSGILRD